LVVGATGYLGGLVVEELLRQGAAVKALVRASTDPSALKAKGVIVCRGDIMKRETLPAALNDVDAVITTAIGYTNRKKGDTLKTDDAGNRNLANEAQKAGIKRFVFTSVLNCEKAPDVPHFWQKKLSEDYFREIGLPFISIRPGAFLNQDPRHDFFAKGIKKGKLKVIATKSKKWTMVLDQDVAFFLTKAALDENIPFGNINIGTDAPISMEEMGRYIKEYTGTPVKISVLPWGIAGTIMQVAGLFKPVLADAKKMFDFFFTGNYIADTSAQQKIFGFVPTNRESVFRYCEQLGLTKADNMAQKK
jgi:uncharacterized protein YbjT (DUF2867 family)